MTYFLPLSEIITRRIKSKPLEHAHLDVFAVEDQAFKATNDYLDRCKLEIEKQDSDGELLTFLKTKTIEKCQDALRTILSYYHKNGKLRQAFTEIKKHAKDRWHSDISKQWETHFFQQARKAGVSKKELEEILSSDN